MKIAIYKMANYMSLSFNMTTYLKLIEIEQNDIHFV